MTKRGKWLWLYLAVILTFLLPLGPAYGRMFGNPPPKKSPVQGSQVKGSVHANQNSAGVKKEGPKYKEGEVIVKFKKTVTRGQALQTAAAHALTSVREFKALGAKKGNVYLVLRSQSASTHDLLQKLKKDANVEQVSPNFARKVTQTVPNDTQFTQLWGLQNTGQSVNGYYGLAGADIRATQAWDYTTGSPSVVVADIDTGADYNHNDLKANIWVNPFETAGNATDDDGNGYVDDVHGINAVNLSSDPMDVYGHGTHTAGTIAASGNNQNGVAGVAFNVKVMPLKFIGDDGYGYDGDAIECINYVLNMKSKGINIVAINASWGGYGYDEVLKDAIAAAGDAGILFIAAAGNEGNDNDGTWQHYPSSYDLPNIISVAASDSWDNITYWSNYGASTVHLAAPGDNILSTVPGGVLSGTPVFFDDMENGSANWTHGGRLDRWALTTEAANSGTHAWSDSPNGNYANYAHNYLVLAHPLDLSAVTVPVALQFRAKLNTEWWYDSLYIEISKDGGATWFSLGSLSGYSYEFFDQYAVRIPDEYKTNKFQLRFRLKTDEADNYDGVYIDDVGIMPIDDNAYDYYSGTSMATPHVSGAIALLASQYPSETALHLKNRILSGVDQLSQMTGKVLTGGRLDIANSINPNLILKPTVFTIDTSKTIYGPRPVVTVYGDTFNGTAGSLTFNDLSGNPVSAEIISWTDNKIVFVIPQDCPTTFVINTHDGRHSDPQIFNLWQKKDELDYGVDDFAAAVYGGRIYTFGGFVGGGNSSTADGNMYDPATDFWSYVSSMYSDRADVAGAELDGKIYVIGGYSSYSGYESSSVEQYDPYWGYFTTMNSFPYEAAHMRAVNVNGTLYVTGGTTYGSVHSDLMKYDPSTDSWTAMASMLNPRLAHAAVALNGKLYVFGGLDVSSMVFNSGEVYDPATNTWTATANMPISLVGANATTDGRYIYVQNGSSDWIWEGQLDIMLRYDPANNSWKTMPLHTRQMKINAGAVFLDGRIYSMGGIVYNGDGTYSSLPQTESLRIDYRPPVTSISPAPGSYTTSQSITLTADEDAVIYYTTDGSTPTTSSAVFNPTAPIVISSGTKTVKFFAMDKAGNQEAVKSAVYVLPAVNTPPTLVAITPGSGSFATNAPITFTATFSDANGASDITEAKVLINTSSSTAGAIAVKYQKSDGKIYLLDDGSTTWTTGTGTVSNSQGSLDLSASSAALSGNTLTLTLKITPANGYAGAKNLYMRATDTAGSVTGWTAKGNVTFVFTNVAPSLDSVTPASGSFASGTPITFTATFSDGNGASDISFAKVLINNSTGTTWAAVIQYQKSDGKIYLLNDAGNAWSTSTTTVSNSQCTLDVANSYVTTSGNTLTMVLKITPKDPLGGTMNIYLKAQDRSNVATGWTSKGTINITFPNVAPTITGVNLSTPVLTGGSPVIIKATYDDANGAADIAQAKVMINTSSTSSANSLTVMYQKADGKFYLLNDAGTTWVTGTSGTLSNTQGSLDLGGCSVTYSGNSIVVQFKVIPTTAYAAANKNVYLKVQDRSNLSAGWTSLATVGPNVAPTLGTVTPSSGTYTPAQPVTFTATYSDGNGAVDIESAKLLINSTASVGNAIAVMYQRSTGTFLLLNDAGTAWLTTPTNSQGSLDLSGCSAVLSGNTLTLTVKVIPAATYTGSKNLYLKVKDTAGPELAWTSKGTVTFQAVQYGTIAGQVKDAISGNGIGAVAVAILSGSNTLATTTTATDGTYSVSVPAGTGYTATFTRTGYISATISNVYSQSGVTTYLPVVLQVDNSHSGTGTVSGSILNAYTGGAVGGATINFRAGLNVNTGTIVTTVTSNTDGSYSASLAAGNYTAEVIMTGFTTGYANVVSIGGTATGNQNVTLTPVIPAGQTRIVLTWGATPSDLDSHLTGPDGSGGRFHTFYSASEFYVGSTLYDGLDIDDTSSYGPETTTVYVQDSGVYRFSVHDYSNRNSTTSTALSTSGATVTVYRGSNVVGQFNVPPNAGGTLWTVFEMNGDTITPINTMTYYSDPYSITSLKHSDAAVIYSNLPAKR